MEPLKALRRDLGRPVGGESIACFPARQSLLGNAVSNSRDGCLDSAPRIDAAVAGALLRDALNTARLAAAANASTR